MRSRSLLLILDNREHLAAACAALTRRLMAPESASRLLATSRVALNVPGDAVHPLRPLAANDAADLFLQRAREHQPDLIPDPEQTPAIAEICRRLDNLPLAIELAARTHVLSVEQIAGRLDRRFALPRGVGTRRRRRSFAASVSSPGGSISPRPSRSRHAPTRSTDSPAWPGSRWWWSRSTRRPARRAIASWKAWPPTPAICSIAPVRRRPPRGLLRCALLGGVERLREQHQVAAGPLFDEAGVLAAIRAALGGEAMAAHWAEERDLAPSALVAEAMLAGELANGDPVHVLKVRPRAVPVDRRDGVLTARQIDVLRLVAAGRGNREIGEALAISDRTVERHPTAIYSALDVDRRSAAVARGITLGLIADLRGRVSPTW